ncbi:MAG: 50S ribosomal protein L6 [Chlamydiota bacterium]
MSRIGKQPIKIPKGVEVSISGKSVMVKGPKGNLTQDVENGIEVKVEGNNVIVSVMEGQRERDSFHGLYRSLVNNMVLGVSEGFSKVLELVGVGFRANVEGDVLNLLVGYSHPTKMNIPEDLTVKVDKNTIITITGANKRVVGQFAADVRSKRPPEPYKGKGIKYQNEYIRRKAGKSAK